VHARAFYGLQTSTYQPYAARRREQKRMNRGNWASAGS
jgi:hypothetical protein